MSQLLTTLVLVGGCILVGWLLGRTVAIGRRDDLANRIRHLIQQAEAAPQTAETPDPELEDVPA